MTIVMTGATGFIGQALATRLVDANHRLTCLVRNIDRARASLPSTVNLIEWNSGSGAAAPPEAVSQADAVINLAGASIAGKRWSEAYKQELVSSRVDITQALVGAMPPQAVLLNMSAVGYYGDCGDTKLTESHPPGSDFLAELTVQWERAALAHGGRVVLLRTGIVLGEGGGALEKMTLPFKWFVGGPLGSGRQYVPWVHLDDVTGMFLWAMENSSVNGALNCCAPEPVTMRAFAQAIGKVMHRPSLLPAPGFALKLALGEFADSLLRSTRTVPSRAIELGYRFQHPDLDTALTELLNR